MDHKQQAMREFHRVLKPGGRLAAFEPINRFGEPQPENMFWGFDVTPMVDIARKLKRLYQTLQPLESDPMMNFDERDLLHTAEHAGFRDIRLELEAEIKPSRAAGLAMSWETFSRTAGNPRIAALHEAMTRVLTPDEQLKFAAHMRPLVESGEGTYRSAVVYLTATK